MENNTCLRSGMRMGARILSLLMLLMVLVVASEGTPRVPRSDAEVLEHVPRRSGVDATRGTRGWSHLSDDQALALARDWMKDWEQSHDPRIQGRVKAVLRRWWGLENPPSDVLLIRAQIRQYGHDFEGAISDLERLTQASIVAPRVWSMLSSVHLVRGDVVRARAAALEMARRHPGLGATATAAAVAGSSGQAEDASKLLHRSLRENGSADPILRAWCWGLLGELAGQLGKRQEAIQHFRKALDLEPGRGYVRVALADQLMEMNKFGEALELLAGVRVGDSDALMVRKVIALNRLGRMDAEGDRMVVALKAGFESARIRAISRHLREEALFTWQVDDQVPRAFELALANWQVQKEPLDARLLLRLAQATGNLNAVQDVQRWYRETGLEDVRLAELFRGADALDPTQADRASGLQP